MAETEEGVPSSVEREMEEGSHSSGADESSSEEMDEGELFEVEKIVSRKTLKGKKLYKVRWKGYSADNDTWEPVDNLSQVLDMVQEFDEQEEAKKEERREQRRLQKLKREGKLLPGEESPDSGDELFGLRDPFWKLMEMGKMDVTQNPDMYSNIKSRAATLASRKEKRESTPSSTPQSERKERVRGRGRGRGNSRGRGKGRARGRPLSGRKSRGDDSDSSTETSPTMTYSRKSKFAAKKSIGRKRPGRRRLSSSEETSGSYSLADSDASSNTSDTAAGASTSAGPSSSRQMRKRRSPKTPSSPKSGSSSTVIISPAADLPDMPSPCVALDSLKVSEIPSAKASSPPSAVSSDEERDSGQTGVYGDSPEVCASPPVCDVKETPTVEGPGGAGEVIAEDSSSSPKSRSKKGKKKSSRKRKQEVSTVAVHSEAVSSGDASPPKMSPSPAAPSPPDHSPTHRDVDRRSRDASDMISAVDESSQEAQLTIDLSAGGSESEDTSPSEVPAQGSARRNTAEKKVPPLVIPLTKLQGCESQTSVTKHKQPVPPVTAAVLPRVHTAEASSPNAGGSLPVTSVVAGVSVRRDSPAHAAASVQEKTKTDAGDVKRRVGPTSSRVPILSAYSLKDVSQATSSVSMKDSASEPVKESPYIATNIGLSRDLTVSRESAYQGSSLIAARDVCQNTSSSSLATSLTRDAPASASSYRDLGIFSRFEVKSVQPALKQTLSSVTSGKENTDRQQSVRPGPAFPKKKDMDSGQPLDAISNTSVFAGDIERASKLRGLDSDFEIALERMDLADIENMLLPAVEPIELSDDGLKRAVMEGNAQLVERALAASRTYNVDMADENGCTLLMHAVLNGYDDIIVHLLFHNASVQLQQKNGVTALMLAVEHAECSTVALLLEMGANINTKDDSGETALIKAVKRGDKQILKLLLENGSNFTAVTSAGYNAIQLAKVHRLADMETTLIDHITRVTGEFEKQVRATLRNTATLISPLFPHQCFPLYESDTNTVRFKYHPNAPAGPGMGFLLFIAHARINNNEVKCRLYGHCAVTSVYLNGIRQPSLTEESNFVLMCHPLFEGYNELVVNIDKDTTSKAKLIVCAYKAQLINPDRK